jgi:hypothetical protein
MHKQTCLVLGILMCILAPFLTSAAMSGEAHHPHHIAAGTGYSWHGDKESIYTGVDYVYSFTNGFTIGAFLEDVRGDFDLQAVGILFGKKWSNGLKLSVGPGVEYKIEKDEKLLLLRATAAYDWHIGNWTVGPILSYDTIEDVSNTTYLGLTVGYGF